MPADLFSTFTLGGVRLANRIVMAPMTRSRATADHVPTPIMAEYYGARASGGLLITEGTAPTANGCGYARIPGIWNDAQIAAWKTVTDAVHAGGGRIALQLMHVGRIGHPHNLPEGAHLESPTGEAAPGEMYTDKAGPQPHPAHHAMTGSDIEAAIEGYVTASRNAIAAGFDFVELHGANGYLIDQFLTPSINTRTDEWGGDAAGRRRFAVEVAKRTVEAIGAERTGIRLSPGGVFNGVTPWPSMAEEFTALAAELGALGLAFLHIVDHSAMGAPPVPEEIKVAMSKAFGGPVIRVGGYDRASADADLAAGKADLIAFGRTYLANPDLPKRLLEGAELNAPDFGTFYTPGPKGYTDYPTLG